MRWFALLLSVFLPFSVRAAEESITILKALPATLAGCVRGEVKTYDKAALGASAPYRKGGLVISLYIFDLGRKDIGTSLDDPILQQAFRSGVEDIEKTAKTGEAYGNLEERDTGKAKFGKTGHTLRARYRMTWKSGDRVGQRVISELHVFGARGQIVKLRITGDAENEALHMKTIEEFIPALVDALRAAEKQQFN
jgi:hypothetical protein